jgi:hypothetical protein
MPSKTALEKKVPSVVIFNFTTENENAKKISAPKLVEDYIAEILIANKLTDLQDRNNLTKLENEIRLAEISGNQSSNIKSVDFAIDGNVSTVTFDSQFLSASYSAETKRMIYPDRYQYTATVQGSIKIYQIPSLKVMDTISFSGSAHKVEEAKGSKIWKIKLMDNAKEFDQGLVKEAVRKSLEKNSYKLKSFFAKTGYIMEKRVLKDKTIFLISLGSNDGIRQEDKVNIYQKYSETNPLTMEDEVAEKLINSGTVADKVESGKSWIVIKNKNDVSKIKLGDIVKIRYEK